MRRTALVLLAVAGSLIADSSSRAMNVLDSSRTTQITANDTVFGYFQNYSDSDSGPASGPWTSDLQGSTAHGGYARAYQDSLISDTKLSGIVRRGIHAVALDEQRADFTPTLWNDDPRVIQMLIPGAHSDVGGGYPAKVNQSGLADGALRWMMEELSAVQVQFAAALPCVPNPDPAGVAHQPWVHAPFDKLPAAVRRFDEPVKVHSSVTARRQSPSVVADPGRPAGLYRPTNLP